MEARKTLWRKKQNTNRFFVVHSFIVCLYPFFFSFPIFLRLVMPHSLAHSLPKPGSFLCCDDECVLTLPPTPHHRTHRPANVVEVFLFLSTSPRTDRWCSNKIMHLVAIICVEKRKRVRTWWSSFHATLHSHNVHLFSNDQATTL